MYDINDVLCLSAWWRTLSSRTALTSQSILDLWRRSLTTHAAAERRPWPGPLAQEYVGIYVVSACNV